MAMEPPYDEVSRVEIWQSDLRQQMRCDALEWKRRPGVNSVQYLVRSCIVLYTE